MPLDIQGVLQAIDFSSERPTVIDAVAREVFVNEAPLVMRLPRVPGVDVKYTKTIYDVRQRSYLVGTGGVTSSATSLPIADSSPFLVGDVLELIPASPGGVAERIEVTAIPDATHLTIRRAVESTTGAAAVATDPLTLIGNSRTGAEINQTGTRAVRTTLDFYTQTFQESVQVGGLAEAVSRNTPLPPGGGGSVFEQNRAVKLLEMIRDMENSSYYGLGENPAANGDRGKQKGLKAIIKSYNAGANVKTGAGASYTKASFIADSIQKIYDVGGMPDVILCSTDFLGGLDTWVPGKTSYTGRETTALGFPIEEIILPLNARPLKFIPALQLRKGTAIILSSFDLRVKEIRPEQWIPRAVLGDAIMGDWLATMNIDLDHPQWHAWVEGITSYA